MSTREEIDEELASDAPDERFNGAELSESVLGRDWNSPEEDAAWSNLYPAKLLSYLSREPAKSAARLWLSPIFQARI